MIKKFKSIGLLLLGSLFSSSISAQADYMNTMNFTSIPPSPQSTDMSKFGGVPISYASGAPSIPIELSNVKIGNNLSVGLSLLYQTNGIQVRSISGTTGYGWSLIGNGNISRVINDDPDESSIDYAINLTNAMSTTGIDVNSDISINPLKKVLHNSSADDIQPDLFSYNFFGHSGQFFLDSGKAHLIEYEDLKIEFQFSIAPWNFKVTDQFGNIFYFGGEDANDAVNAVTTGNLSSGMAYSSSSLGNPKNNWSLTQVITPEGDTVNFTYVNSLFTYTTSQQKKDLIRQARISGSFSCNCAPFTLTASTSITGTQKLLSKISINNGQNILLSYKTHPDVSGFRLVDKISFRDERKDQTIKEVGFHYLETNNKRVFLDTLFIFSQNNLDTNIYSFKYISPADLPLRNSNFYDKWGFFNTDNIDRQINCDKAKTGLLSEIKYPTGGKDELQYICNGTYENVTVTNRLFTNPISGIGTGDHGIITYTAELVYSGTASNFKAFGQAEYNSAFPPTEFDKVMISVHKKGTSLYVVNSFNIYGNTFNSSSFNFNQNQLNTGDTLVLTMLVFGQLTTGTAWIEYNTTSTVNQFVAYGGMAVSKVTTSDPYGGENMIKKYVYSNGQSVPYSNKEYYQFANVCTSTTNVGGVVHTFENPVVCEYELKSDYNLFNLYSNLPSPFLYMNVSEYFGENGEFGLNERYFSIDMPMPASLIFASTMEGVSQNAGTNFDGPYSILGRSPTTLKSMTQYKKVGSLFSPVLKTEYKYKQQTLHERAGYTTFLTSNGLPYTTFGITYGFHLLGHVKQFIYRSCWNVIDTQTTSKFFGDNTTQVEKVSFEYQNNLRNTPSVIRTSNPADVQNEIIHVQLFPQDYVTSTGYIQNLKNNNQYAKPVEQLRLIKNGNSISVTEGLFNEYDSYGIATKQFSLTLNVPESLGSFKISNRALGGPLSNYTMSGPSKSTMYTKYIENNLFDERKNSLQQVDESGKMKSYLYAHKWEYLIADVNNSDYASFAYTSFEDDNQKGQWNYSATIGNGIINMSNSPTGKRVYEMSTGQSVNKNGLNPSKRYFISFYFSGSTNPVINGLVSSNTSEFYADGYRLFQGIVTGINNVSLSFPTGGIRVDELRLHPETAEMTTYAYDESVGIISKCDRNSKITHYEYDSFGKLYQVKDQFGHIINQTTYKVQESQ